MPSNPLDKNTSAANNLEKMQILPPVSNGELGTIVKLECLERKTMPPKPYTEGGLIEDMANCSKHVQDPKFRKTLKAVSGLGTAATRSSILEDLKKYGLLVAAKGKITATEKGRALINYLPQDLCDIARTAVWEAELNLIGGGSGNRAVFESEILTEVTRYLGELKGRPAMGALSSGHPVSSAASLRGQSGSDKPARPNEPRNPEQVKRAAPTDKQLDYASKLAARLGLKLPAAVESDFEACRQFLDKYSRGTPPSAKAISFAESIANRKALQIPDNARQNARDLSAWIDVNK